MDNNQLITFLSPLAAFFLWLWQPLFFLRLYVFVLLFTAAWVGYYPLRSAPWMYNVLFGVSVGLLLIFVYLYWKAQQLRRKLLSTVGRVAGIVVDDVEDVAQRIYGKLVSK